MEFKSEDPICYNQKLCSVEIFVPSQILHPSESFQLMGSAWFGTVREEFQTASGVQTITVGLKSATLSLDTCSKSRMLSENRYRSSALTISYESQKEQRAERAGEGSAEAKTSISLLGRIGLKGAAKVQGEKSTSNRAERHQDSKFEVYEIDSSSPTNWSIKARNPARPQPFLSGAEIRDEVLCTISSPEGNATVTAELSVASNDLWLDVNSASAGTPEDEANQRAVLSAIITKGIAESEIDAENDTSVVVARSVLHRQKSDKKI